MTSEPIRFPENFTDVAAIGEGGMGVVYKAFDTGMSRTVAIKVIRPEALDAAQLKRFRSEVKAMSKLDHPNIIRVHAVGMIDDTQPYMVLDFVAGESLDKVLAREEQLPLERALPLFQQLAAALSHAHSKGILHRDVKPANVILASADGQEVCRLVDFGIARNTLSMTQDLTQPGTIVGSPTYAAPEQCTGAAVDERSDIYSLGCLMYEVVSGRRPFTGDTIMELIMEHCSAEAAPLDNVPAGIDRVIRKCLQKKPEDRFQNTDELLEALEKGDAALQQATARPVIPGKKPGNFKYKIAVGAFGIALLGFSSYILFPQAKQPAEYRQEAKQLRTAADQQLKQNNVLDAERSYWLAAAAARKGQDPTLPDILYSIADIQQDRDPASAHVTLAQALPIIEESDMQKNDWAKYAKFHFFMGRILARQNRWIEADTYFQNARRYYPDKSYEIVIIDYGKARSEMDRGKYRNAEVILNQRLQDYAEVLRKNPDIWADALHHLGLCQSRLEHYDDAIASYTKARNLYVQIHDERAALKMQDSIDSCKVARGAH